VHQLFFLFKEQDMRGEEIHKMFTRFADFDSIGSNPALKATYSTNNNIPLIRIIAGENWIEQPPIPLKRKARLTKNISVLQTGWGQNSPQLRVQGQNQYGQNGFYFKNIYQTQWNFEITDDVYIDEEEFLSESLPHTEFEQGPQIAFDYKDGHLEPSRISSPIKITLEKFIGIF
jgi:hypothetical protein